MTLSYKLGSGNGQLLFLKNAEEADSIRYSAGELYHGDESVGHYSSFLGNSDRATSHYNAAMLWTTLLFPGGGEVVRHITLMGVFQYGSGVESGHVVAASPDLAEHVGKPFMVVQPTLTIG